MGKGKNPLPQANGTFAPRGRVFYMGFRVQRYLLLLLFLLSVRPSSAAGLEPNAAS
jgi:hypothetical protein